MDGLRAAVGVGVAVGFAWGALAGAPTETPRKLKADPAQEFFLYLPKGHDPKQERLLFVAVHAANGNGQGACGWSKLADEARCVVLAPTFKGDFKDPAKGSGERLKAILKELRAEHKLGPKVFLTGFAEGAAFAHRFAMDNPALVLGCAAHSADGWDTPDPKAREVPFLITCGKDDKQENRIGDAKKFVQALKDKKFADVESAWPKGGHSLSQQARDKTKDFFLRLATGMNAWERKKADASLSKANAALKASKFAEAAAAAKELLEFKPNASCAEKARAVLKQVDNAGKARLAQAEEQAKSDPQAAVATLEQIQADFAWTPTADAAAARIKAVEAALKAAQKREAEKADGPDSERTKAAAECRQWLTLAENYIANGKTHDARALLHKLIEAHPNTEFAERAKAKLDALR